MNGSLRWQHALKVLVEGDHVLVQVLVQVICAKDPGNLDKLVVVVVAVEEWLLTEDLT